MQIITNQFQKELKKHGSDHFPFLVSYQRLSEYDSNSFLWHCHPEIEITYIKKGSRHYRVNNRSFHLKEGDIVFCIPMHYIPVKWRIRKTVLIFRSPLIPS